MSNLTRAAIAIVAAAGCLIALAWVDARVLADARQSAAANFDHSSYLTMLAAAFVLVAGAILLVAAVGWWSRSAVAGVVFVLAGAFLVLAPALTVNRDLPQPVGRLISDLFFASTGPIFAVEMLGGAMPLVGLIVVGRTLVRRSRPPESTEPPAAAA
jgi:hypothetical protein